MQAEPRELASCGDNPLSDELPHSHSLYPRGLREGTRLFIWLYEVHIEDPRKIHLPFLALGLSTKMLGHSDKEEMGSSSLN